MKSQIITVFLESGLTTTMIIDLQEGDKILEVEYEDAQELEEPLIVFELEDEELFNDTDDKLH